MEMGARARQERQIMALLKKQNPFVVRLFFSFHTMHHLFLVMEYVPGSDCAAMLRVYGCLPEGEGGREGGVLISYDASLVLVDGVSARE